MITVKVNSLKYSDLLTINNIIVYLDDADYILYKAGGVDINRLDYGLSGKDIDKAEQAIKNNIKILNIKN